MIDIASRRVVGWTTADHLRTDLVEQALRNAVAQHQPEQCWDNAVAESFFATIKTELLDRQAWPTKVKAHKAIFEYVEGWYNTRRRHSSLGYLSPAAYEASRDSATSLQVA